MSDGRHWHVATGERDGVLVEDVTGDTARALDSLAAELDWRLEQEYSAIHAMIESHEHELACDAFLRWERWEVLLRNVRNAHKQLTVPIEQRAPLYQYPATSHDLAEKHASWIANEVSTHGPDHYGMWECTLETCERTED